MYLISNIIIKYKVLLDNYFFLLKKYLIFNINNIL